ncbi:hypothetical protein M0R45_020254 [Rubus argutus]|uniref:Sacsin/Nov domain-containing protein n=1 Tax=Rubus argutus TaxID=59490 RepID=A0AAW1XA74_RUBAR
MATMTPREHIEHIRQTKFSIGGELNPLTEDLHEAVKNLAGELYAKDIHFFMELVQNAEDNEYSEGNPSLEFVITSRDITATGAPATLLIFNNEKGFSPKNIDSICSVGRSTKKGNRKRGYIGEKGIGFKSVFLITAQPHIFSNGYQIRFSEKPCVHCNVGYIVPEWVEQNPTLSDIEQIYGSTTALPTTTLILPLKPDKVEPVKKQLSVIHPEVLLFLSKIKRLYIREDKEDSRQNTVSAIEIARQTELEERKNINAESYTLHLSAEENCGNEYETECRYYMWKQKFPVRQECRVERRMEVDEWVITLAFPFGERLRRAMNSSPGVYSFLPTEMITNFPFIIQADFLLASSREAILLDNKWNQGILECVPEAFVNAFTTLVKTEKSVPASTLSSMFKFLPVQSSSCHEFNVVRDSIQAKLVEESIVPSETDKEQKFFYKPCEVGRLMPAFWSILMEAKKQEVSLINLSSHGTYVLSYSFDGEEFDDILNFLGVEPVSNHWYVKCIQGTSELVAGVTEDVYLKLLLFIADNWESKFVCTDMKNIPLIKYEDYRNTSLCSIHSIQNGQSKVSISSQSCHVSWLIDWNKEFVSVDSTVFMPKVTQEAIQLCSRKETLVKWLEEQVKISPVNVYDYAVDLLDNSLNERKLVIAFAHFLYQSSSERSLSYFEVDDLCGRMPLVNKYGNIIWNREGVIVPAYGSKWAELTDSNPWIKERYVELSKDYMNSGYFAGKSTPEKKLVEFLIDHAGASDVPKIPAPDNVISSLSAPLTKQNAFLLLEWIHYLKSKRISIPQKFLTCIKEGSWLKVTLNGSSGFRPPSQSFLLAPSWEKVLQHGFVSVDIPLIDLSYYGEELKDYKEELATIGVMFEFGEACEFIGNHFMSLAASSTLTSGNVLSILGYIKFLRENYYHVDGLISSIKEENWLKTSLGYKSPVESVLSDSEWNVASKISDIPFIDQKFYGEDILYYKTELELLGVAVSFSENYQLIIDNLKSPSCLTWTSEVVLLMLECMYRSDSSERLVEALKGAKCLKTNVGYMSPSECLLFHSEWGCILQVFNSLPLIDHEFYGSSIFSYRDELEKTGVVVDFEEAAKAFASYFKQYASSGSISKEHVESILLCYRTLKRTPFKLPKDIKGCIRKEKWLRTHLGDYRSPSECILYSPEWESIEPIARLPFIDDSDSCYGNNIYEYKAELKKLGVVVEFNEGVKFVASGLHIPQNASLVSPENALALLECVRVSQEKGYAFSDDSDFMEKVSQPWLKTHAGYRSPKKSLLFDSEFGLYLEQTDGPFIDEEFYGSKIKSYREELSAIGVTVEKEKGCPLIAGHLDFHDETSAFVRIYSYLSTFNWKPDNDAARRIWIPEGEWVSADKCVLYDKDGLFGLQMTVLEKHYEQKPYEQNLLLFFSSAFRVKSHPSVDDYLKLWKDWESSGSGLSHAQCCKFWSYISKHWNSETEKTLADALVKVPVNSHAQSEGILLRNKSDVFIADDLQLKDLFEQSSSEPIFIWYPQRSLPSLPRTKLLETYRKIGVCTISESVHKEESSLANDVEVESLPKKLIKKALFRLVLGFLAGPTMQMEAEKRHEAVQCLVKVTVVETTEPITVSYNLTLSSGKVLNVRGSRKIRFDRENSKIFTQKMGESGGQKSIIESATFFSQAISEIVLWKSTDHIDSLSELIKVAALLDFNEEAVDFLMKSKNLQIFIEDEEFLESVPSD